MNTANWIPDLFMKRVMEGGDWTLFSPSTCPDLHDLFGAAFEKAYTAYEAKADRGEIKLFKRMPAVDLWRKMLTMLFETGHPWITFKDACNVRSPQQHVGVVHSSNLCTEITLNTSDTRSPSATWARSTWPSTEGRANGIDHDKLKKTVSTAMRMLDNVIDINYYAVKKARDSNLRHRPVGLGIMGFQDALYELRTPYASQAAVEFADRSMEAVCYYAYWASTELAAERGRYSTTGLAVGPRHPADRLPRPAGARGGYVDVDRSDAGLGRAARQDRPRRHAQQQLRGHRPDRDHLQHHRRGRLDRALLRQPVGQVQPVGRVHRHQRVPGARPEALGLWDDVMVMDLKHFDGSLRRIDRVPDELKRSTPPPSRSRPSGWWKPPRAARSGSTRPSR
jgi:ribonucleoside-diphosphate reductase alpha chain